MVWYKRLTCVEIKYCIYGMKEGKTELITAWRMRFVIKIPVVDVKKKWRHLQERNLEKDFLKNYLVKNFFLMWCKAKKKKDAQKPQHSHRQKSLQLGRNFAVSV